jgi:hypothetical protein
VHWDPFEAGWKRNYNLLVNYHARSGHADISRTHEEDGVKLGAWLHNQITAFKAGELDEERQAQLNLLGVKWSITNEALWESHYTLLLSFCELKGHADVPLKFDEEGTKLGVWLHNQRAEFRAGKMNPLRWERLKSLGVNWGVTHQSLWEERYRLLSVFRTREGHVEVPETHVEEGMRLGAWLKRQRLALKAGKLNQARQDRLDALGFNWGRDAVGADLRLQWVQLQWDRTFNVLKKCSAREGQSINVLARQHIENGANLGEWLHKQRLAFKNGELTRAQQEKLASLGCIWNIYDAQWERNLFLLSIYLAREGHVNVPQEHSEQGVKLGIWLATQRQTFKVRTLEPLRQARLEALDVVWDAREAQWARIYGLLTVYCAREGRANVPWKHEESGVKLGIWLHNQRAAFKFGELDDVRRKQLELLGCDLNRDGTQLEQARGRPREPILRQANPVDDSA